MWPVSLARSWSHGERYRLHGRTPSGLSSAPFFLQKKTVQLASSDSRHDHERYRGIESDISFNFSFFIHISKHLERHSCMEKEISFGFDYFSCIVCSCAHRFVTICVKFRFVRRLELIILDGRFIHLWVASFIKASFVLAAANKLKT